MPMDFILIILLICIYFELAIFLCREIVFCGVTNYHVFIIFSKVAFSKCLLKDF